MKKISFQTLKTNVTLNFIGCDRRLPSNLSEGTDTQELSDISINFYQKSKEDILEVAKNTPGGDLQSITGRLFYQFHDLNKKESFCYFEEKTLLDLVVGYAINMAFFDMQVLLDMIFLHAASIVIDGKASLFIAPSGGGKSTISTLASSAGFTVLDDETCTVKKHKRRFYAGKLFTYEPPVFSQKVIEAGRVLFLNKSDENKLRQVPVVEALGRAFTEATWSHSVKGTGLSRAEYNKKVFSFLDSMLGELDFNILDFRKEESVFRCLKQ